jgi:GGDEF domain-containing protein
MSGETNQPIETSDLQQAAVHCYLSTVLTMAESMAEVCPQVGVAYKNRWRRLPQRIAFDLSTKALEASRRGFETDIRMFSEFAGSYFRDGIPLLTEIAASGSGLADSVLERAGSHVVLMETLADSIETAADLDASPEVRDTLEHHSAGLRRCARQAESDLLPLVSRLRELIGECEKIVERSKNSIVVDPLTGFMNALGWRRELESRMQEDSSRCILVIHCLAKLKSGGECTDDQFERIAELLSARVAEQFRPNDAVGRFGRSFPVIFEGESEKANNRLSQIARSISGLYPAATGVAVQIDADIKLITLAAGDSVETIVNECLNLPAPA